MVFKQLIIRSIGNFILRGGKNCDISPMDNGDKNRSADTVNIQDWIAISYSSI